MSSSEWAPMISEEQLARRRLSGYAHRGARSLRPFLAARSRIERHPCGCRRRRHRSRQGRHACKCWSIQSTVRDFLSTGKRRDRHKHGARPLRARQRYRDGEGIGHRHQGGRGSRGASTGTPVDHIGLDQFESAGLWEELKFDLGHRSDIGRIAYLVNTPGEEWAGWQ